MTEQDIGVEPVHMALDDEDWEIAKVAQRLCVRFPTVAARDVERVVAECRAAFDGRPLRMFVALLVEKMASDRLRSIKRTPPAESTMVRVAAAVPDRWIRNAVADGKPWVVL